MTFASCRAALVALCLAAASANAASSHCTFRQEAERLIGGCGTLFDQTPVMTLAPGAAITTGVWRKDESPRAVWSGDMTDSDYGKAPLELEIYAGGRGILRTVYGWFAVTGFTAAPVPAFELDVSREIAPGALDAEIVKRAAAILSTPSVWNRADNRRCPPEAATWSIYCSMQKATVEVTGAFHHRRPALEVVRAIVDERTAKRNYQHRLMDYNNDPATRLDEVDSLFREALADMKDPAWLAAHGFAPPGGN